MSLFPLFTSLMKRKMIKGAIQTGLNSEIKLIVSLAAKKLLKEKVVGKKAGKKDDESSQSLMYKQDWLLAFFSNYFFVYKMQYMFKRRPRPTHLTLFEDHKPSHKHAHTHKSRNH